MRLGGGKKVGLGGVMESVGSDYDQNTLCTLLKSHKN